jgi:two-component system sensor histidine kinase SenX3
MLLSPWERGEHSENAALSRLSHELRTPITVIALAGHLLERSVADADGATALFLLKKASSRMAVVVEDLLLYTRLRGTNPGVGRAEVDFGALVQGVVAGLEVGARTRGAVIVIRAGAAARMRGDSCMLANAARQLISNAVAFSPRGGVIAIAVERRGDGIELSVADDGPGIPSERLSFIFQAFYQGENAMVRENGGLGLGLTLARLVAEAHGGRVSVESRTGGGSRFALWLRANEVYD